MPNVLSSYIEKKIVPNKFPTVPNDKIRLAIVGEAPGQDEELMGTPFVGASGRLLRGLLSNVGVAADQCFIGNICQVRPPDNDISTFPWDSEPIQSGLQQLKNDLTTFRPNCVLSLGRSPLRAFRPDLVRVDKKGAESMAIGDWRGSILPCTSDLLLPERNKIVVAYHPAYILRLYSDRPLLSFDIARAAKQARFPEINSTNRLIHTRPTCSEVLQYIANVRENRIKTAFDIEGWTDNVGVTMLSIARSPTDCMVIPFFLNGQHYWTLEEEILIWTSVAAWAADPDCPKTAQNAMYELFVLAWSHKLKLVGVDSDTMFKHWELFPEFEKSLALQTSIYTEEPYYKDDRESTNTETRLLYNGKDSCVTLESDNVVDQQLAKLPRSYDHYRFNISLLPAINYLSLRGCCFSADAANSALVDTQNKLDSLGAEVNQALGREFNAKSVPDKQWLLYTFFGYEPYKKYGKPNISTNEETLLRYYSKHRNPLLKQVITLVSLRTRKSDIGKLSTDTDGRIRSNFNLVGTNTARISSSSSSARIPYFTKSGILKWDFSGTNLQNVTKDLRICFTADTHDHAFFQCDLSGADGWTVAADLAALGHSTMLDDYLAGIKPAKVLLLMLDEYSAGRNPASINNLDRQTLRNLTKSLTFPEGLDEHGRPGDWKYLCMKRVQHGCVTAGHEVLTTQGWKTIETLQPGETILTYDHKTSTAFWDTPSKLTAYAYTGTLYNFKGTAYNLTVTHDHRMPFVTNARPKECLAEEMYNRRAGDLPVSATGYFTVNSFTNLQIQQLAAFQADGYCTNQTGRIGFHLKRQRKITRLMTLFGEPIVSRADYANPGAHYFEYDSTFLYSWKITDWRMLQLDGGACRVYLDESILWDGSTNDKPNHKRVEITTAEWQRAEVLNTMARLAGYGSQLTPNARLSGFGTWMHSVSLNRRIFADRSTMLVSRTNAQEVPVFCVTVTTGFFFIRRNNKIMITGNTNYGMEPDKLSATIFKDSEGTIDLTTREAGIYQYLYKLRYNPQARIDWIRRELRDKGYLQTASGFRRQFFGIRNRSQPDDDVVREALACEPQANTTYVCNLALQKLWYDSQNRTSKNLFHVEPLILIHDAIAGQFKRNFADSFAVPKLKTWFNNPIKIHGIDITIPFEGGYGTDWKNSHEVTF